MPIKTQKKSWRARLPRSTIYKNSKNIERTLFWWAKIKTWTLSKNVKIDPQEHVLQGFPLPLLSTKTPKTYRNKVVLWQFRHYWNIAIFMNTRFILHTCNPSIKLRNDINQQLSEHSLNRQLLKGGHYIFQETL